jgi:hypothetical protein
MKQPISVLALGAVCLLAPIAAQGQGEAGSGPSDYPDPHCPRPKVKLVKPAYTHRDYIEDSDPVGSYNEKVKIFNREAQEYDACMHAYIDNANTELKRVQTDANNRIHQITDVANARLKMIEGKIAAAVQDANQVSQDEAAKQK